LDLAINGELLDLVRKVSFSASSYRFLNGELIPHLVQHGSFDIDSARRYGAQIIDTIDFMHERGVIHR
jgi:serine/threonine protein kinase